ncbi:hypothetical protein LTR20_009123 [Exophiala xenobiotica]|nr:hypothetical protein LTS13_007707 [Exophiala xenobiotica]KAK5397739.1 hypothetical protein LTR79_005254 [Exophiala xenobiotica]KAK5421164.1 hypothetical protein LTR90_002651 [Exophiala xenobiotica]KAK5456706.1 hypothetical protein LTR20_009123 [Exophiala xenobiotica]KAK5473527.1 hypothetical protein LTR26_010246 [Exophiala xenobiotica]
MSSRSLSYGDYTVACICPMGKELAPVLEMLDERHPSLPMKRAQNCYTLGRIGEHNIVVTTMPEIGTNRAAHVGMQLMNDFPSVRFGLLVGIGGGLPDEEGKLDIHLGDIVVSKPTGTKGGVIQYDMGKPSTREGFCRTGSLAKPPTVLLTAIESLEADRLQGRSKSQDYLSRLESTHAIYCRPGSDQDILFKSTYSHPRATDCRQCDRSKRVRVRSRNRSHDKPVIHYGTIGSGNVVVKDAATRNKLRKDGIICVEMEAAGLMDTFPCLVIRGICDYADSHKSKVWQPYAAAAVAAYMKDLLRVVPSQGIEKELKLVDVVDVSQITEAIRAEKQSNMMTWLSGVNFWGKQDNLLQRAQEGTGEWILREPKFKSWLAGEGGFLWCYGEPGVGKTILSSIIIQHLSPLRKENEALAWIYVDYRERSKLTMENVLSNLLAQLFKQHGEISQSTMKSLGVNWQEAKPTLLQYRSWLQDETRKFSRTTVIIDALDELPTKSLREQLIRELRQLQPPIHLLVTSRPLAEMRRSWEDASEIAIRPQKADVISFVKGRLTTGSGLWEHIEQNGTLLDLLVDILTKANDRILEIWSSITTRWTAEELKTLCDGLVIIETKEVDNFPTQYAALMHETASTFLKNVRSEYLPAGHAVALKACLAYMSLSYFSHLGVQQIRVDERARKYPFYNYAAKNWSQHALQGALESTFKESIINFLESPHRQSADELIARHRHSAWGCEHAVPWTDWNKNSIERRDPPVHAAASYGLSKNLSFLLDHKGYKSDTVNNFGETPLHRAAQTGKRGSIDVLLAHGADMDAKVPHHYLNDANVLLLATLCQQVDAILVFLNHGLGVNTYDPKYLTFPLHIAASTDTNLTRLLLDYGAKVDFPGKSPVYPETFMTSLHYAVFNAHVFNGALDRVSLLLDRGTNINMQSIMTGNTPLHMAILGGHEDLMIYLLERGANINVRNKAGKSVVQLLREKGLFSSTPDVIPAEVLVQVEHMPPLHYAAWSRNHAHVCQLLAEGHDMEQKDQDGSTIWDHCIASNNVELAKTLVEYVEEQQSPQRNEIGNAAFELALKAMTAFDYTDHKTWESSVKICQQLLRYRKEIDNGLEFARARSPICDYNKTYLIWAAEQGRISQAQFLLDCGADVNAADRFGSTGMHYAVNNRDENMIKLLMERGFDLKIKDQYGYTPVDCAARRDNQFIYGYLKLELSRQSR